MTNGGGRTKKVLDALEMVAKELGDNDKLRAAVREELTARCSKEQAIGVAEFLLDSFPKPSSACS